MEEKDIVMTTGDIKEDYKVIDVLYVKEHVKSIYPSEKELNQFLCVAKERIKKQCRELGENAIICCNILYYAKAYYLSISGTAVKIKSKS